MLAPQQHRTGAGAGLSFGIETGKYQLKWREKLFFGESGEKQAGRTKRLAQIAKLNAKAQEQWFKYHDKCTETQDYKDTTLRQENKRSSQARLDQFRGQFKGNLAAYQRRGCCPEQYLTRIYTRPMSDLWERNEVRTWYSAADGKTERPIDYQPNPRGRACQGHVPSQRGGGPDHIIDHPLPASETRRPIAVAAAMAASSTVPRAAPNRMNGVHVWPQRTTRGVPDARAHFMDESRAVSQQHALSTQMAQRDAHYVVQKTLPYLTEMNRTL